MGRAIAAHGIALVLCLAILTWSMELWRADLRVPFQLCSDCMFVSMLAKRIVDDGWYLVSTRQGMPFGSELYDFPLTDTLHFLEMRLLAALFHDHAAVLNLHFLLSFPLIAVASLFALRRFAVSYPVAITVSLLYAFLPYHFMRGFPHAFHASYFQIPLMTAVLVAVCLGRPILPRRSNASPGGGGGKGGLLGAVAIVLVVSCTGTYYAFFAAVLLVVAGAYAWARSRRRSALAAALLLGVLGLGFSANFLPTLLFTHRHGRNEVVAARPLSDAELYALKVTQLVAPTTGHRVAPLARLKGLYNRSAPLINENDTATLGLVGSCGFLVLVGWLVCGRPSGRRAELLGSLSVLNVSALLLATTGGFGALFALIVSPQIRSYNRISVYIAFFSLSAVAVLLDNLAQGCSTTRARAYAFYALLALVLGVGVADQTTANFVPAYEQIKDAYRRDAEFIGAIETQLRPGAMVFQLPHVPFPEHPPLHRMLDYDHLRGYLHSRTVRWSYGAVKGRPADLWQRQVAQEPVPKMLRHLALAGFQGVYIDRFGYADAAASLERGVAAHAKATPLISSDGRLVFFNLTRFAGELRERYSAAEWRQLQRAALRYPVEFNWGGGCSGLEENDQENWHWCAATGALAIDNPNPDASMALLMMSFATGHAAPAQLEIESPWFSDQLTIDATPHPFVKRLRIPPGRHLIRFRCNSERLRVSNDPRELVFRVVNFRATEAEESLALMPPDGKGTVRSGEAQVDF